jgi:hypothetical protein
MSDDDPRVCIRQRQIAVLKALAQAKGLGEMEMAAKMGWTAPDPSAALMGHIPMPLDQV